MGKIIVSKEKDEIFGNLISITNGIVELKATLDYGPRILAYNFVGMENMLFTDPTKSLELDSGSSIFGEEKFKIIGGHRLMISPEIMPRAYYPDTHPVELIEKANGISLTAPYEEINHIQKSLHITLSEDSSSVEVLQQIQNCGTWDLEFAVWGLTVMAQGGIEVIAHSQRKTGFLANRLIALWDYTQVHDERAFFGDKYITLKQDPTNTRPFKIGTNNEPGWAAYFNKNQLFIKHHIHVIDANYPDFGFCSYETYTNNHILELETIGPLTKVAPMDFVTTIEQWDLYKEDYIPSKDEDEIESVLAKYLDIPVTE